MDRAELYAVVVGEPCGRSLCGSVYVQNVNNLRAEKLSACTLFCFPLGSETRQVEVLWGMWSGLLRVNGSLSAGRISWMFWEAVMETGEVRRPIPPPRVFAVSEQRRKGREKEPVAVQNVFGLLCINFS